MRLSLRDKRRTSLEVFGNFYEVKVVEIPFREGVEASCLVKGKELRFSDRGLGEHEAIRLLKEAIQRLS